MRPKYVEANAAVSFVLSVIFIVMCLALVAMYSTNFAPELLLAEAGYGETPHCTGF
jgi:hypothetical protein